MLFKEVFIKYTFAATVISLVIASSAMAQSVNDSTGYSGGTITFGDTVYSSTWNRVSGKPNTATRWPTFAEVTNKPSYYPTRWSNVASKPSTAIRWPRFSEVTHRPSYYPTRWSSISSKPSSFPPSSHDHDGRYVRQSGSGSVSGNFTVGGRLTADSIKTDDVSGGRWCRASSSGVIRCTESEPSPDACSWSGTKTFKGGCDYNNNYGETIKMTCSGGKISVSSGAYYGCSPSDMGP